MKKFFVVVFLAMTSVFMTQSSMQAMQQDGGAVAQVAPVQQKRVILALASSFVKGVKDYTWDNGCFLVRWPARVIILAALWKLGNAYLPHA